MIGAEAPPLPAAEEAALATLTAEVAAAPDHAGQVERAGALWASRMRADAPLGGAVRELLDQLRPGEEGLCRWCEVGLGHTLDHIEPNSHAPLRAFAYENLLPACQDCQNRKGDRWAVVVDGALVEVARGAPAPEGPPALISPRGPDPDPAALIDLDLALGALSPSATAGALDALRARYTVAALALNQRGGLVRRRKRAYLDYLGWLRDAVDAPAGSAARAEAKEKLQRSRLPCVWAHMKRQATQPDLAALFAALPEALGW